LNFLVLHDKRYINRLKHILYAMNRAECITTQINQYMAKVKTIDIDAISLVQDLNRGAD